VFYLATYMLANIAAFTVVGLVSQKIGSDEIKDFAGLSRRSPYLALGMVGALLSLLGAPPLVGFIGKAFLFRSAIGIDTVQAYFMVGVGVFSVLVSCWYYLGIVKAMYVDRAEGDATALHVPAASGAVVFLAGMGALLVGIPVLNTPFWDLALSAAKAFLNISVN
jgi:NADH-quinone oxidoreductase subunit N